MQIRIASIPVLDQDQALRFYTDVLGFTKMADIPMGEHYRWLTVVAPEGAHGVELALEPLDFEPARVYQRARREAGIPATGFVTTDIHAERARLVALGVTFRNEVTDAGPILVTMFDDTCGNWIHLVQPRVLPPA
jgi:catechol 2,3-dioxygenase-like lactoylglutathione lyase family enzyme